MESREWLVLHDQVGDGNGFRNGGVIYAAIPFPRDVCPREAALQLFENNPHHDARAFERRLAAADSRVGDDVASQLDPLPSRFRFHADAPDYAPG